MKKRIFWSKKEDELLINNYLKLKKEEILELLPYRSWKSIRIRALSLGMKRLQLSIKQRRKGNVESLICGSYESYYWLGFLLADGYFNKYGCISLTINNRDKDHIEKYSEFVKSKVRTSTNNRVIVEVQHPSVHKKICNLFNINERKTYHCPTLPLLSDNEFIAFFVGLVDGDGHITESCIRFHCHLSWSDFYQEISDRITTITKNRQIKVIKKKYMKLNISNYDVLSFIKNKIIDLQIPYLNRKWDKIDEKKKSKFSQAKILNQKINGLKSEGKKVYEIANVLNMSVSGVYRSLSKNWKYK